VNSYVRGRAASLPRGLTGIVRRLDEAQLRRLLILVRGLLLSSDGPEIDCDDIPGQPRVSYRRQYVRCGKDCQSCPHGPYWYAFWKEDGRSCSQYVGTDLPGDVQRALAEGDAQAGIEGGENVATVTQLRPASADRR
jgi:hypothetical protein